MDGVDFPLDRQIWASMPSIWRSPFRIFCVSLDAMLSKARESSASIAAYVRRDGAAAGVCSGGAQESTTGAGGGGRGRWSDDGSGSGTERRRYSVEMQEARRGRGACS